MRNIDLNDWENADKFRSFDIDDDTLNLWTNEWLNLKLSDNLPLNIYEFTSLIYDLGYRINRENAVKVLSVYEKIKSRVAEKQRLEILFDFAKPHGATAHYYGLIYVTAQNNMVEALARLLDELRDLLKDRPDDVKKQYEKNLKALFKYYGIKI